MSRRAMIVIPGEPVGKARPRFSRGRTYTPKKTTDYEAKVRSIYAKKSGIEFGAAPLSVKIKVYYPIPKSTTKAVRAKIEKGEVKPTKKPDVDNIVKILLDALNGIAYDDDKQVISLEVEKEYATAKMEYQPCVTLAIEEVEGV